MRIALITSRSMSGNIVYKELIEKYHNDIIKVFIVPYLWTDTTKHLSKTIKLVRKASFFFSFYKFLEVYGYRWYCAALRVFKRDIWITTRRLRAWGIPVEEVPDVNAPSFIGELASLDLDYVFSYCPQIYRQETLKKACKNHVINLHGALLPEYRGAASYFWCVFNGEPTVGYTIHVITEGIDSGAVYYRGEIENHNFSAYKVNYETIKAGASKLPVIYDLIKKNEIRPMPQDEHRARYYSVPTDVEVKMFFKRKCSLVTIKDFFTSI